MGTPFAKSLVRSIGTGLALFFLLPAQLAIAQQKTTAAVILRDMQAEIRKHRSVSYHAAMQAKFSNIPDTFSFNGHVLLDRVESDTVLGGRISFTTDDSAWTLYDLKSIYEGRSGNDSCTRYDPAKGQTWAVEQNMHTYVRWRNFQFPARIDNWFKPNVQMSLSADTMIRHVACWHVHLRMDDEGTTTNFTRDLYISKKGHVPILQIHHLITEGDPDYSRLELLDHTFDMSGLEAFDLARVRPHAIVADLKMQTLAEVLPVGTKAPTLIGDIHPSPPALDTLAYNGHITVIDFWYMSCPPCRGSIPVLDSLYSIYGARGVQFVGVDCYDGRADNLSYFTDFLGKHPIHYPILFADPALEQQFLVSSHPVLFIVGRDGNIAYHTEGYGPGMEKEWGATLDQLLQH